MAAPAILLFLVMCLAQIFGGSGSVEENHSINNGEEELAEENIGNIRGSSGSNSDDIQVDNDSEDGIISVEHHHGHKKKNHNGYSGQEPANDDTSSKNDSSFDYYAYSMTFQPEFCRENKEKFTGCQHFQENWEGQLTIHGLWPNVSIVVLLFGVTVMNVHGCSEILFCWHIMIGLIYTSSSTQTAER